MCLSIQALRGVMKCRLLHMHRRFEKISVFILGRINLDCLTVTMKALKFFEASKNIYPATHPNITEDFNLYYYYYYYYYLLLTYSMVQSTS